jgi:hypothetical protein
VHQEGTLTYRIQASVSVISAILFCTMSSATEAQRRVAGQAQPTQRIEAALKLGGEAYTSSEPGKCTHAPTASIYQVVSELWSVQQSSDGRSLSLSFWRPKDGSADMVTFSVTSGNTSHQINTVRGAGTTSGSGKVTLEKSGNGGTFPVDARAASGVAVIGTIKCDSFAPHVAEGGL